MTKYLILYLFPPLQHSFSIATSPLRLCSTLQANTTTTTGKSCSLGCKQRLLNSVITASKTFYKTHKHSPNLKSCPSFCHPVSVATMNRVTAA
ncbi:hypothetical protein EDD85DRAFT_840858 [Armillaria nabsnona]|nr:hypothetical protein EDD85DRAFT_840858 [Armillaria nabsnona]